MARKKTETKVQARLLTDAEKAVKRAAPAASVSFTPPEDVTPSAEPVAAPAPGPASIALRTAEQHAAEFPQDQVYMVRNHLQSPLTINLCAGKHVRMWRREGAALMVNKDMPQACKSCPGRELHLLANETKQVGVVMQDCWRSEQVVGLLESPLRMLSIRRLEKGPADKIVKTALKAADLK